MESKLLKQIGKQLKDCMEERGITKRKLASCSGFTEPELDKIILGRYNGLTVSQLYQIFSELEYKVELCLKEI